jgi:membrane protease YdiL (CAAX protease family)
MGRLFIAMPPAQEDFWLSGLLLGLATASIVTWCVLLGRLRRGPILAHEPRRPVPWNAAVTLLPILFVAMAVLSAVFSAGGGDEDHKTPVADPDVVGEIVMTVVEESVVVGLLVTAVVVMTGATKFDLGLPEYVDGFLADVKTGIVAWLAALVPVYGTQVLLVKMFGEPSQHPLIQMVAKDPNEIILAVAFLAAVVVAPICEEIMFRLLLQGWLEKWEDRRLGWRRRSEADASAPTEETPGEAGGCRPNGDGVGNDSAPSPCPLPEGDGSNSVEAPIHGLFGLPHGWVPILISSTLFALAHFGFGPDPIPLFLLALVLGYTYQRTHRIVPCMVAHALFNSLTLIALWRMLWTGEPVGP